MRKVNECPACLVEGDFLDMIDIFIKNISKINKNMHIIDIDIYLNLI
jgi:hypothetical protein